MMTPPRPVNNVMPGISNVFAMRAGMQPQPMPGAMPGGMPGAVMPVRGTAMPAGAGMQPQRFAPLQRFTPAMPAQVPVQNAMARRLAMY